jgi:hypothetical protein
MESDLPTARIDADQSPSSAYSVRGNDGPLIYRCPNTGLRIQALAAEEITEGEDTYEAVTCIMCRQVHLVNPHTGKVLGEDTE